MDTSEHNLAGLFAQLGLENSDTAIAEFVGNHRPLAEGVNLADAGFLSASQQAFIREQWELDSDWCEPIDELDALLRH